MSDYRVWRIINFPNKPTHYMVASPKEGALLINQLAKKDLHNPNVGCNAFGMEVFEDGEWCEWYDKDGNDIEAMADELWDKEK